MSHTCICAWFSVAAKFHIHSREYETFEIKSHTKYFCNYRIVTLYFSLLHLGRLHHHLMCPWRCFFKCHIKAGPLDLSFWSFLTFLHHGIEEIERNLLWKFYKQIRRKSWSNVPPKLLACIGFLYKVVHKNGRLWKFIRSREIEFNFLTAWTISMKFGTLVQHAPGYKALPQIF